MKTTEWYPCSTNPHREGEYELTLSYNREPVRAHYSHRRGWTVGGDSMIVFKFYDFWRGLTEKAK